MPAIPQLGIMKVPIIKIHQLSGNSKLNETYLDDIVESAFDSEVTF